MNRKFFICLILFFGLIFANQPSFCLSFRQQSVFNADWQSKMSRPNGIVLNRHYFFTNTEISNLTTNDSIRMQELQSDASRITFGKIALEASGGLVGGALITYFTFKIGGHSSWWPIWGYGLGFSFGPSLGVTLVGNSLNEPNGSFTKSLISSSIGTILGMAAVYPLYYVGAYAYSHDPSLSLTPLYIIYGIIFGVPASLSTIGAVIGYHHGGSGCCLWGAEEIHNPKTESSQLNKTMFKAQILSIKF